MSTPAGRRHGGVALTVLLVVVAIVGISVVLVTRRAPSGPAHKRVHFSGARAVSPMPSLLPAARLAQPVTAAIVRDPGAAAYFSRPDALDSTVARWRRALTLVGAEVLVVTPAEAVASNAALLVVPSSPCLGVDTREALTRAAAAGRGVILTAAAGVFDGGCSRVGYGLLVAATEASRADTLESRNMVYVTIPGSAPLSADLPPGSRLEVAPGGHVALRRAGRDAFYSEYDMDPAPARGQPLLDAAIVHAPFGNGRVVWWGFELDDVGDRPWNRGVLALLVRNAAAWASGQPLASLEAWPRGDAAAAVLAQDVEAEFTNARHALDSLVAAGVPATYYLTSNLALKYRRLSRALAAHGEIGTHTDRHQLLGGAPADSQAEWLRHSRDDLTRLLGRPVKGLRPPEEQFDATTLAEWAQAGGDYVFGANDSRVAAPELLTVPSGGSIVLLARATDDDVIALRGVGPDPVRALADRYRADYARVRALGGLYLLSYHSQLLARPELVPALASLARTLAADEGVWRTTAGDVARWWRARSLVRVTSRRDGKTVTVTVRNEGAQPLSDAVLRIVLGPGERAAASAVRQLPSSPGVVRLVLPPLPAGQTQTFSITVGEGS